MAKLLSAKLKQHMPQLQNMPVDSITVHQMRSEREYDKLPPIQSARAIGSQTLSEPLAATGSQSQSARGKLQRMCSKERLQINKLTSEQQFVEDLQPATSGYKNFLDGLLSPNSCSVEKRIENDVDHHGYFAKVYCRSGIALNPGDAESRSRSHALKMRSKRPIARSPSKHSKMQSLDEVVVAAQRQQRSSEQAAAVEQRLEQQAADVLTPGGGDAFSLKNLVSMTKPKTPPKEHRIDNVIKKEGARARKSMFVQQQLKIQREACAALRMLVFDKVGNEWWRDSDKHLIYEQSRGTEPEVRQLFKLWNQLDDDGSGDITTREFLDFFRRQGGDRRIVMKCVKYLVGFELDEAEHIWDDEVKKRNKGCTASDLMRTIWLKATADDIFAMLEIFQIAALEQKRVQTPKMLPKQKRKELYQTFKYLDKEGRGAIEYGDMVTCGFMDKSMANELMDMHGADSEISFEKFLEMWCPQGYRAHNKVKHVIDDQGRNLVHVVNVNMGFTGWMLQSDVEFLQEVTEVNILT